MNKFNLAYNTIIIMDELKDHEHTNWSMREFIDDEAIIRCRRTSMQGTLRRSMQATFTSLKRHDYIVIDESNDLLVITEAGHQFYEEMYEEIYKLVNPYKNQ